MSVAIDHDQTAKWDWPFQKGDGVVKVGFLIPRELKCLFKQLLGSGLRRPFRGWTWGSQLLAKRDWCEEHWRIPWDPHGSHNQRR